VVGSLEARNCPTSGDVHLYSDPHTAEQDYPILYADCEGLEGGEMLPTGTNLNEAYGTRGHINTRRAFHGSERRITWATTAERQTRQFAVANLYPRFLYTFSDVVVFVLKNGRRETPVLVYRYVLIFEPTGNLRTLQRAYFDGPPQH
jgi:hypothetical protein